MYKIVLAFGIFAKFKENEFKMHVLNENTENLLFAIERIALHTNHLCHFSIGQHVDPLVDSFF